MSDTSTLFHVIFKPTGKVVGKSKTASGARKIRDRKDNEYGSYAHTVKPA